MHQTYYAQIMEYMDVLPIISDGFNIYYPMTIFLGLCLAAIYFSLGARFLTFFGFQQFVDDEDDITVDLSDEGRELIKREKRMRQKAEDNESLRRNVEVASSSSRVERVRETGVNEMSPITYPVVEEEAEACTGLTPITSDGLQNPLLDQQSNETNPQVLTRKQRINQRTARRRREKRQQIALAKAVALLLIE